ncbi:MAG: zeta toxin family protein [Opitutales bacterium]|nr:zeta toxin family protein [Opitutales bacterium]
MTGPAIYVLAGVNGSGKSSIGGASIQQRGAVYYNPDTAARKLRNLHPNMTQTMANGHAWTLGKELLEQAISGKQTYAFETTLGGTTISRLLTEAAKAGIKVNIWYAGLESVELNIARVNARVAQGGHDIPKAEIRKRWDSSRRNLIKLLPHLHSLRLYDNSSEADPTKGNPPKPVLLLHLEAGKVIGITPGEAPEWAKPIIAGALNLYGRG